MSAGKMHQNSAVNIPRVFVSTGGLRNQTAYQAATSLFESGIDHIELSGGLFSENIYSEIGELNKYLEIKIHNYFPPPREPFVLNLASLNEEILNRSIEHCKRSIELASTLKNKEYSIHAGFLIDPDPKDLGRTLTKKVINDRKDSMNQFVKSLELLADYAKSLNCKLLIENNVISASNYAAFGKDILLMTNPEEVLEIFRSVDGNVGFLLDTAHWKVSANTLGYNFSDMWRKCKQFIKSYHLSENDGKSDLNMLVNESSESLSLIREFPADVTLEVYDQPIAVLKNQREWIKSIWR